MKKISGLVILALVFMTGCNRGKIFEQHQKMDRLVWNRFDMVNFEVDVEEITTGYDFYVAIRHITDVPYRQLDLSFYLEGPDGSSVAKDVTVPLRDKEGELLGKGLGELWDVETLAKENQRFSEPGRCKIEISSRMQQTDLVGVLEVGLIVRKTKP